MVHRRDDDLYNGAALELRNDVRCFGSIPELPLDMHLRLPAGKGVDGVQILLE
jgi:hypothetical protein